MFEKLITNLKKSLPGGNKNDEEEQEESVEETEGSDESEESESDSGQSAEDEKKKKTSMIIKVVVIVGLGYLAIDQFFLSANNEPNIDQLTSAPPKKRRKPKLLETTKTAETPKTEIPAPAVQPQPEPVPETPPVLTEEPVPPVESINIADKPVEEETDKAIVGEIPEKEPVVGENNLDQRLDQLIDNVEKKETSAEKEPDLAEKIVEEETYTAPPDYDALGRGLVYNCKDKFWACIDKPGYITCGKNMKWNKAKGNAMECAVQNVYSSDEDCIKIQKYNVSTNQETKFCQ